MKRQRTPEAIRCTVTEASRRLGKTKSQIYQLIYKRQLKATKKLGFPTMVEIPAEILGSM